MHTRHLKSAKLFFVRILLPTTETAFLNVNSARPLVFCYVDKIKIISLEENEQGNGNVVINLCLDNGLTHER